jgi:hypothetical protein
MDQNQQDTIVVVGGRFAGFAAALDNVCTVEELAGRIVRPPASGAVVVSPGQGVEQGTWLELQSLAERSGTDGLYRFVPLEKEIVGQDEAHKHSPENTLISDLGRSDKDSFTASLFVHNNNELLLDHQTGLHVQGMVTVEAARQMFLAVSERYYVAGHPEIHYYYVIDRLATTFENFLFPMEATIGYRLVDGRFEDPTRLMFMAEIWVMQGGRRATRTEVSYTAFDTLALGAVERRRALQALDRTASASRTRVDLPSVA